MRRAYSDGRARYGMVGLLALGLIAAMLLTLWLVPRPTPLVPNQLASMSEQDQVEWIINRILERSGRDEGFKDWLYSLIPVLDKKYPLGVCFETLAAAAASANRPALIQRLYGLARTEREREFVRFSEARLLLKRGEVDSALRLAEKLSEKRGVMLCVIASAPATPNEKRRSLLEQALASSTAYEAVLIFRLVAATAADLGYLDLAESAARRARAVSTLHDEILRRHVVPAYVRAGRIADAGRVARQISDRHLRGVAYAGIAAALFSQRQPREAYAVLSRAGEPTAYACTARLLQAMGQLTQARELWQKAEQLVQRLLEPARSEALYRLAMQYARAGEITSALRVYRQATPTHSRAISDLKQNASLKIAVAYATQGKLREALAVLDPVAPPSQDPYFYAEIICTLYQNGYHQQAREVLQRMCTHIQQKDPSWSDPIIWWTPVRVLSAGQARPLARELVQWLDGELRRIGDNDVGTLSRLAALYGYVSDLPRAVECAARARRRHHQAEILLRALDTYTERQIFWENLGVVLEKP